MSYHKDDDIAAETKPFQSLTITDHWSETRQNFAKSFFHKWSCFQCSTYLHAPLPILHLSSPDIICTLFAQDFAQLNFFFYLPLILILMFPSHCCNVFSPFSTFSFALFSVSINAPFCGRFLWQGMRHEATIFSSLILATDLQDILKINFIFIKGVSLSLSLSKVQKTYFIWGGVGGSDHFIFQMRFCDITTYVWGLGCGWGPSLSWIANSRILQLLVNMQTNMTFCGQFVSVHSPFSSDLRPW